MKRLALIVGLLIALPHAVGQEVEYVDDEACGCELVFVDGIQTTQEGDRFGFRLADGRVIAPNRYMYVDKFREGYCRVFLADDSCGLIDREGNEVVPCVYDNVSQPSEGRVLVLKNNRAGYCDMQGRLVIEPRFLQASDFHEGVAPVMLAMDGERAVCSYVDTMGNVVFDEVFENVMPFNEGYALVMRGGRWGLIDRGGNVVLPLGYSAMTLNTNGLFFAGDERGMALFDYSMAPITPFVYTSTTGMYEGRIGVCREGKYGFLDEHGREVIPCKYDATGVFQSGRTMVMLGNRFGIIDTAGNVVLPIEYDDHTPKGMKYMYYDGLALVEKDGKVGYVGLDGEWVVPLMFEEGYQYSEGLAAVRHHGMWGYIDSQGDVFMPFIFNAASPYEWGRAEVVYDGAARKVDRRGKCVKNCNGIIAWREWKE